MSDRSKKLPTIKKRDEQRASAIQARAQGSASPAATSRRGNVIPCPRQQPVILIGNAAESAEPDPVDEPFPYPSDFSYTRSIPNLAMTVVGQAFSLVMSVQYVTSIICRPSAFCREARRGHKDGTTTLTEIGYPGIPEKKYNIKDEEKILGRTKFQVQAYYEKENTHKLWNVLFGGWDCSTMDEYPYKFCEEMATCELRAKFLESLIHVFVPELRENIKKCRFLCDNFVENPTHRFWTYEDLSHFHSMIQLEKQMAQVFYFCFLDNMKRPPKYHYTAVNVVEEGALMRCLQKDANKTFAELNGARAWRDARNNGPCEKPETCKCNARFNMLYKRDEDHKNVQPKSDGTLDMSNLTWTDKKIVIECSEECGCSSKCPRRRLQQGQVKALAAVYQDKKKGFGLRAVEAFKEGELICEYTGYSFSAADKTEQFMNDKCTSYEADFQIMDDNMIIDSLHIGNISRFLNHHCNPNSYFIETESREFSTQPLIPRIAVYARRDIEVGEEITLCYYDVSQELDPNGIDCNCGAIPCIGKLPLRS